MSRRGVGEIGKGRSLTSKEVARLLGVSEASVKRWADVGILPMEKTAGGHRRFRPDDVALFRRRGLKRERGRAPLRAPRAEVDDAALVADLFDALVAGRAEESAAIVVKLHLEGYGVASIFDGVLAPAMRRVGDLWHEGALTIAQEHVATVTALTSLDTLRVVASAGTETTGFVALCCSTEEDFHTLPVRAASLLLEEGGWKVVELGPNTPFYSLAEAVKRFVPRLVCVASTMLLDLERAARDYTEFRAATARAGASVVLGGAGFADARVRARFPAELHAEDFAQLAEFAARLASPVAAMASEAG